MLPLGHYQWDKYVTTGTLPVGQVCYYWDVAIGTDVLPLVLVCYHWDWYVTTDVTSMMGILPLGLVCCH